MTPDPLAALLHEPCVERWQSLRDNGGFGTTTHGVDAHEAAAARLRAAGVTLAPDATITAEVRDMTNATITMLARVGPETEYRSLVTDPMPTYPEYAGRLAAGLISGAFKLDFTHGYARPADIRAAIDQLRDALDQLNIAVSEAIANQAVAALPVQAPGELAEEEAAATSTEREPDR